MKRYRKFKHHTEIFYTISHWHHFTFLYQVQVFQLKRSEDEKTHSIFDVTVLCFVESITKMDERLNLRSLEVVIAI